MTPKELILEAKKAIKANNLLLAVNFYTQILNKFPKHSAARLGLSKIQKKSSHGSLGIKQKELNDAVNALQNGNFETAINFSQNLIIKDPNHPVIHNIIGISYVNLQKPDKAISYFKTALRLNKYYNEARGNLGSALLLLGKTDEAVIQLEQALKGNPKNPMAWNSLGNARDQKFLYDSARKAFEKAIELSPNYLNAFNSLGVLLNKLNLKDEAIKIFETGLKINPNDTNLLINFGYTLSDSGKLKQAIKKLTKGISLDNYPIDAKHRLGVLKSNDGDIKSAIKLILESIKEDPTLSEAYRSLSLIYKFKKSDELIDTMRERLNKPNSSVYDKIHLGFALGKSLHDIKEYDDAFKAYEIGNIARRSELVYDIKEHSESIERIKTIYSNKEEKIYIDTNHQNVNPIFIVGMNRSGTTLVEQILSAHSKVTGAGELPNINKIGLENLKTNIKWTKTELICARAEYSKVLESFAQGTKFVTDKLPVNFKWIGLIKILYPKAKIIHLIRNPMDTCLSNYRNYFIATGNAYAYNQKELANFYIDYRNLMEFWHMIFPNQIYACDYDSLTFNQETETRLLLKYCKLNWEPEVMKFEKNTRAVKTASVAQVREGLYRTSVGGWENYKEFLDPLYLTLKKSGALKEWDKNNFA